MLAIDLNARSEAPVGHNVMLCFGIGIGNVNRLHMFVSAKHMPFHSSANAPM
jgi:hypothetical protein